MTDTTEPILVHPEDVPSFADEAEEEAWWATHELEGTWTRRRPDDLPSSEHFRQQREARRGGPRRTQPVLVRLDADILDRLRALADRKGTGYQTLLKRFVMERLYEEEKLEGQFIAASADELVLQAANLKAGGVLWIDSYCARIGQHVPREAFLEAFRGDQELLNELVRTRLVEISPDGFVTTTDHAEDWILETFKTRTARPRR
jgi:uncharacterized protein (DUF4415 family)